MLATRFLCFLMTGVWFAQGAFAQTAFSVSDTARTWTTEADVPYTYGLVQFTNHSGATLPMRYDLTESDSFPSAWTIEVETPRSHRNSPLYSDSFDLAAQNDSARLFFCIFHPNGQAGSGYIRARFAPLHQPQDSAIVYFRLTATPALAAAEPHPADWLPAPNPVRGWLSPNFPPQARRYWIVDALGQTRHAAQIIGNQPNLLDLRDLESGVYWLLFADDQAHTRAWRMHVE